MVSCSVIGCSNRGEKGFSMKSFPKDPTIRKKWQENVNRVGWEPTEHSKLCEIHFLPEMWEKPRVDGKKKLKWNAVPTIFPLKTKTKSKNKTDKVKPVLFVASNPLQSHTEATKVLEPNADTLSTDVKYSLNRNENFTQLNGILNITSKTIINTENPTLFHNYAQSPNNEMKKTSQAVQANPESIKIYNSVASSSSSDFSESFVSNVTNSMTLDNADLFKKMHFYQKSYTQLFSKVNNYKEQIKMLTQRNECLVKIAKKDRHLKLLKHVFNDDQICALEKSNRRFMKWSQSTLINALRLKNYCGKDGYEEILRQKFPLPSIRTLNRIKITDSVNFMIGSSRFST